MATKRLTAAVRASARPAPSASIESKSHQVAATISVDSNTMRATKPPVSSARAPWWP